MDLYFEIAGGQIDGARDYQEDAFLTAYLDDDASGPKSAALVVMADGMGGHAAGNIASNLVVSTFNKAFAATFGKQDVATILRDALIKANNDLSESIRETPALDGMGCTMVAGAFYKGKVWWVSVGDSHLYLVRDRELVKENEDHSYGGYLDRMAAQGMDVEPEPGLSRNMLMSAMTGEDIAEIDCPSEPLQLLQGDRLIIASDGLDTLGTGAIIQMSAWSSNPKECVDSLLKAVEDAAKPRQDNTTVVVVDVLERRVSATPTSPPTLEPMRAAPKERDPDATQPLDVAEIEAALRAGERAAVVHREADYHPPVHEHRRALAWVAGAVAAAVVLVGGYLAYQRGLLDPLVGTSTPAPAHPPGVAPAAQATPTPPPSTSASARGSQGEAVPAPGAATTPAPAAPAPAATSGPAPTPAAPAASTGPGEEFRDKLSSGGGGPMMVDLPAGRFEMGSPDVSVNAEERPQHTVRLQSFAIGKYETTVDEYRRFARATGRRLPRKLGAAEGTHPATFVSWDDALAYTKWLSRETGHVYRLPSEAQWEYAARAGSKGPYWWGYEFKTRLAHCFDCDTGLDPRSPTDVGRFEPNSFDLYDTAGNVQEWVYDCYHPNYQGAPGDGSVFEGGQCEWRVVRGGAYGSPSTSLRSAKRSKFKPGIGYDDVGFRVVRIR